MQSIRYIPRILRQAAELDGCLDELLEWNSKPFRPEYLDEGGEGEDKRADVADALEVIL